MKHRRLLAVGAMMLALCSWSWTVGAQESTTGAQQEETDKFWQSLPPDEQAALREKWDNMTPQEVVAENLLLLQVRFLKDARLIRRQRRGRNVFYALPGEATGQLIRDILRYAEKSA